MPQKSGSISSKIFPFNSNWIPIAPNSLIGNDHIYRGRKSFQLKKQQINCLWHHRTVVHPLGSTTTCWYHRTESHGVDQARNGSKYIKCIFSGNVKFSYPIFSNLILQAVFYLARSRTS